MPSAARSAPTAISLFSGAGGFDYGIEAAGFRLAAALEIDPVCCASLRASRPWPILELDLLAAPADLILRAAGLAPGHVDLLIGGPPCQPFSKSGWWSSGDSLRMGDERAGTISGYLRVLRDVQPRAFVLENVEGLAFARKDEGLRHVLREIDAINRDTGSHYRPAVHVLNAADFGVPQTRTRVFIVGLLDGREFRAPAPSHAAPEEAAMLGLAPWTTAWDAIGDLGPANSEDLAIKGKWAELIPSIPEGQNYLWHTERMGGLPLFGWRRRFWNFLLKLAKGRPSWTIQAQPGPATGPFHWHNRLLSAKELAALQTFPSNATFVGARADVQRQIGNAVPSLLAEVIGRAVRSQLRRAPVSGGLTLLPPRRAPVPPPEPVRPVPVQYRQLIGNHQPHPGTGKGALYAPAGVATQS